MIPIFPRFGLHNCPFNIYFEHATAGGTSSAPISKISVPQLVTNAADGPRDKAWIKHGNRDGIGMEWFKFRDPKVETPLN